MAQRLDAGLATESGDPTLHAASIHPQPLGDLTDGTTRIDFQQGQNASKKGGLPSPS
jgi:hypothetical protein